MVKKNFQNIRLSALGLGNMRLPKLSENGEDIDYSKAFPVIDYAYEHGINYFDTAYVYNSGDSEKCVGAAMKKYDRDTFYIATKFHIVSNPDYKAVFEEQLRRLQTDHIDFYLIHCLTDGTIDRYLESGAIEYFQEMKKQGKISYLGFSSHAGVKTLERFADSNDWDFAQIQLNYFDWYFGTAKQEYEALYSRNIPVMVMEPVRGGRLSALTPNAEEMLKNAHPEWSISSWALRFVKSLPGVQVVLSGMNSPEMVAENIDTFSDNDVLNDADQKVLGEACALFRKTVLIPCTACRYCTGGCPMQINIPAYLKIYNDFKVDGPWALMDFDKVESDGKPADCLTCGACMQHCPQGIQIPDLLAELAAAVEKK